jgi:hypothetical protein
METIPRHLLTILLCLRALPDIGFCQTRDGFMGHPWGTPVATLAQNVGLKDGHAEGETLLYRTAASAIGEIPVDQCDVEFLGGRLAGVIVTTCGLENSRQLLSLIMQEYGEGRSTHPRARTWLSHTTHVSYDEDSLGDAYVYWYSMQMQK